MPVVAVREVSRFTEECLVRCGAPAAEARRHAALLVHADSVGHHSHGVNRLSLYLNDIKSGACNPAAQPVILKEAAATAWVDGRDALGATVGHFCMDLAIKKAKEAGVGWVCAKGSNHYGMAGYWALQAEKEGLIGMAFTNTSPIMVPTRAKQRALGTNPIGMAAPAEDGDSMLVDMAMTTVAMGKIEIQLKKQEPLPEGWALGPDGKVTTEAQLAFDTGCLLPLGGSESTSGYKGYGLSAMVEIFCSALSGTPPTHQGRPWTTAERQEPPNLAQCFVAVNPEFFAPGFRGRVTECLQHWRNLEPMDPSLPVLAPGDKERNNAARTHVTGSVAYAQAQVDELRAIAHALQITPITVM